MNAKNYSFDKDDNFLYLFNPFGKETSRDVIKNIKTSLKLFLENFLLFTIIRYMLKNLLKEVLRLFINKVKEVALF